MLISTAAETARQKEQVHLVDNQPYRAREYVGNTPDPSSPDYGKDLPGEKFPQGYLVMQPPNSVTRPHFHQTNQFQVFVGGSGRVGKQRADPVIVQFAGADTPYGPIVAEDDGIHYFTLRQAWDSGAKYLPAQSDQLVKGRQRQIVAIPQKDAGVVDDVQTETLIAPADDGLLAERYALAPGVKATLPDAGDGGGQYHVVVSGALMRDGQSLPELSVEFASPDEGRIPIEAGADGLEMLLLRFPIAS